VSGTLWELLGEVEAPYEFPLDLEAGTRYEGGPPWPDLLVTASRIAHVRRIVWHEIDVVADRAEDGKRENVRIGRLVAELEGDRFVELERQALPMEALEAAEIDPGRCAACGGKIPRGDAKIRDGAAYHDRCWDDGPDMPPTEAP
jgi:hypothetical protein